MSRWEPFDRFEPEGERIDAGLDHWDLGPGPAPEWLAVRQEGNILLVRIAEIEWIEAQHNDVILHVAGHCLRKRRALKSMESALDPRIFIRIQRSLIVRIDFIRHLTLDPPGRYIATLKDGTRLMMSRTFLERSPLLREVLGGRRRAESRSTANAASSLPEGGRS